MRAAAAEGVADFTFVGLLLGRIEGTGVGPPVGSLLGITDGTMLGKEEGSGVGPPVGSSLGITDG